MGIPQQHAVPSKDVLPFANSSCSPVMKPSRVSRTPRPDKAAADLVDLQSTWQNLAVVKVRSYLECLPYCKQRPLFYEAPQHGGHLTGS